MEEYSNYCYGFQSPLQCALRERKRLVASHVQFIVDVQSNTDPGVPGQSISRHSVYIITSTYEKSAST